MSLRSILDLSAFKCRLEDPTIPLIEKVGHKPFLVTSITKQHVKFARAHVSRGKLRLEPTKSVALEDIGGINLPESLVQEMLALTPEKLIVCGLNTQFKQEKLYPRGTKVRDVERLIATESGLRAQLPNDQSDTTTNYSPFPVRDKVFLGAQDQTRINEYLKRLADHGFCVACIHTMPCTLIAAMGEAPMDWDNPGIAVFFHQNMVALISWSKAEVLNVRTRPFAPSTSSQRGGIKPATPGVIQDLLKAIKEQAEWTKRTNHGLKSIYLHASFEGTGDKQNQTLDQMVKDATGLTPQPIPWTHLQRKVEFPQDAPQHPEMACLF